MKTLLVPYFNGGKSHQIPLYVLSQRYLKNSIDHTFLLPRKDHVNFLNRNSNVLDIDFDLNIDVKSKKGSAVLQLIKKVEKAVSQFSPDFIVEDNALMNAVLSAHNIPIISVHRTGFFRSIHPSLRNSQHGHSMEKEGNRQFNYIFTCPPSDSHTNKHNLSKEAFQLAKQYMLGAKTKLIPGVPSVEVLPSDIDKPESYFYTGPLLMKDNPSPLLQQQIDTFFTYHQDRKKAFVTTGLIDRSEVSFLIQHLLDRDYAVITTVPDVSFDAKPHRLLYSPFLPLDMICSKVDLVVHHCGSGMYHYPLLHLKPTITIGTQCYDREDVALRLEQLGVSKHTPSPYDDALYLEKFIQHVDTLEQNSLCNFDILSQLREEITNTMLGFNMQKAIEYTLNDSPSGFSEKRNNIPLVA